MVGTEVKAELNVGTFIIFGTGAESVTPHPKAAARLLNTQLKLNH